MTVVSFDASLLVNRACLAALHATDPAAASQANAFAAHMLGAFRVENVLGMYLYALLSAALAYASSVPTPATRVGVALYTGESASATDIVKKKAKQRCGACTRCQHPATLALLRSDSRWACCGAEARAFASHCGSARPASSALPAR